MIKLFYLLIVVLLFEDCQDNSTKVVQSDVTNGYHDLLSEKRNVQIYRTKDKIPQFMMNSLSIINGSKFEIGDSTDKGNISFSDASTNQHKYNRMLNFVCLSDSISIISYKQGGIGTHDVVFVFYKKDDSYKRYLSIDDLSTLDKVIQFLQKN